MDFLLPLVQGLVDKYPAVATIIFIIGILRVSMKPLFALLHAIADSTETTKDNEKLAEIEGSSLGKSVLFILDWFASIKLPVKK